MVQNNQQLDITNAHASLKAYLENKIGSLDVTNINQLIDHACVLGYSVSSTLLQAAEEQVGGSTLLLMCNREYDFNQGEGMVERVIKYAKTANRYPIVVFNPTANQSQNEWIKHFDPEQVQIIDNKKDIEINHNAKLIYTHKALKHMNNIPLLISYVGMMIGADKQLMSGAAEKIFFTAKKLK